MPTTSATARIFFEAVLRDITIDGIERDEKNPAIRQRLDLPTAGLKVWGGTFTDIADNVTTVLDLFGTLTDSNDDPINWATINVIAVQNRRVDAGAWVKVGPNTASNPFGVGGFWEAGTDRNKADENGGVVYFYSKAGVPVTDTSADLLALITSSVVTTGLNAFDVLIAGVGA